MKELLGLPIIASTNGAEVDQLIYVMHVLMALLFFIWGAFFLYTLFRFHRSRNPKADYLGVKSHASSYLEVAVFIFEVVLLVGFSIPIWANRVSAFPSEKDATVVRIVAQQFAWNIHYAGPDGVFGKTNPAKVDEQTNPLGLDRDDPAAKDDYFSINQLHVPANKPVIVHLSSKDVIHSFGLPEMRVKHDVIPGMDIPVWFVPNREGQYEIVCSQLCGLGHYRMRGEVHVDTAEQFAKWQQEQQAAASQSGSGDSFWQ